MRDSLVSRVSRRWDKGVDYETAYTRLLRRINSAKNNVTKCYLIISLIQLRNGSRISEAIRASKDWVKYNKTELYVRVSKKKREELRLMIIPPEIQQYRLLCTELLDVNDRVLRERVRYALRYYLNLNTHSLRYAFITYLLKNNINVAIVSKLIKHSRLDTLLHYVQVKESERVLREMM